MPPRDRRIHGPARDDARIRGLGLQVSTGDLVVYPAPAVAVGLTVGPIVLAGDIVVTPAPASAVGMTVNPIVIAGGAPVTDALPQSLYWRF